MFTCQGHRFYLIYGVNNDHDLDHFTLLDCSALPTSNIYRLPFLFPVQPVVSADMHVHIFIAK